MLSLHPFWREVVTAFQEVEVRTISRVPIYISDASEKGIHSRVGGCEDVGIEHRGQGRLAFEID